ncbi:hypothetical protein ABIE89_002644 [Bradyrhizobium niftali]
MAKYLDDLPFAASSAAGCGIGTAVSQLLFFRDTWTTTIALLITTVAASYFVARWQLRRMNLPLNCTYGEFRMAAKSQRLLQ